MRWRARQVLALARSKGAGTAAGRYVERRLGDQLRHRLYVEMDAPSVTAVLDAFETVGADPCVAGGWGVDALCGRQTRRHLDLDVIVNPQAVVAARRVLADLGFDNVVESPPSGQWMSVCFTARDEVGRGVDVLVVDDVDVDPATGVIEGHEVRCLTRTAQLQFHEGYELRDVDRRDLRNLLSSTG
jgi:lincosamide nucleotidyltransferase A/C/D/E